MKRLLIGIISKDLRTNRYFARFLDYPNDYVTDEDHNAIVDKAERALTGLFNESPVDEPKSHAEAMEYIAKLKAEGFDSYLIAFRMERLRDYKVIRINISMRDTELALIDSHAHSLGLTRSAFLCETAMIRIKAENPDAVPE